MLNLTSNLEFIKTGNYQALVQLLEQNSERAKEALFSQDIKSLMSNSFANTEYIFGIFTSLMLSGTTDVISKLQEFQLSKRALRWFLDRDELIEQLNIISDQGIEVEKDYVLLNIYHHLLLKFYKDFHIQEDAYKITDGVLSIRSTQYFKNLKARRNKNGGYSPKTFKGEEDYKMNSDINRVINETENNFNLDIAINVSKGKTEKPFLKAMLETGFIYDKTKLSERKFLAIVYNLFRMIMLDKKMENFDSIKTYSGKAIKRNEKTIGYKRKKDYYITEKANKMKQFFYK